MGKPLQKLFLLFILVLVASPAVNVAAAQVESKHHITLSSGINIHAARDQILSPLIYTGNPFSLSLSYRIQNKEKIYFADIDVNSGTLNSTVNNQWAHYYGSISLAYLKRISPSPFGLSVFAGGSWTNTASAVDPVFRINENTFDENFSGYFTSALHINAIIEKSFNSEQSLTLEIGAPLLSYTLRPGATLNPPDGLNSKNDTFLDAIGTGRLYGPLKVSGLDLTLSYHFSIMRKFFLIPSYHLNFVHIDRPLPVQILSQQLSVGVNLQL